MARARGRKRNSPAGPGAMPLFRVTKKLATALKVKSPTASVEHENAEHEWFADLFYVDGKKCVIWVHRPTLLTFVRPAVVAAELREFHALFRSAGGRTRRWSGQSRHSRDQRAALRHADVGARDGVGSEGSSDDGRASPDEDSLSTWCAA